MLMMAQVQLCQSDVAAVARQLMAWTIAAQPTEHRNKSSPNPGQRFGNVENSRCRWPSWESDERHYPCEDGNDEKREGNQGWRGDFLRAIIGLKKPTRRAEPAPSGRPDQADIGK